MSRTIKFKRYPANAVATIVGADGEIIIDTTNKTLTVHDGVTPGGSTLASSIGTASLNSFRTGSGVWNEGHLLMGAYHLWIDSTGRLRIKSSAPTSDTDGTVVGTQV